MPSIYLKILTKTINQSLINHLCFITEPCKISKRQALQNKSPKCDSSTGRTNDGRTPSNLRMPSATASLKKLKTSSLQWSNSRQLWIERQGVWVELSSFSGVRLPHHESCWASTRWILSKTTEWGLLEQQCLLKYPWETHWIKSLFSIERWPSDSMSSSFKKRWLTNAWRIKNQ